MRSILKGFVLQNGASINGAADAFPLQSGLVNSILYC